MHAIFLNGTRRLEDACDYFLEERKKQECAAISDFASPQRPSDVTALSLGGTYSVLLYAIVGALLNDLNCHTATVSRSM